MQLMYVACDRAAKDNRSISSANMQLKTENDELKVSANRLINANHLMTAENERMKEELASLKRRVGESDRNFSEAKTRLGLLETELSNAQRSKANVEAELVVAQASCDQAYNQGVNDTKVKFKAQMPQFEELFFGRGWKACLTKQDFDRRDTIWTEIEYPRRRDVAPQSAAVPNQSAVVDPSQKEASGNTSVPDEQRAELPSSGVVGESGTISASVHEVQ
jgi:hypothetical protein